MFVAKESGGNMHNMHNAILSPGGLTRQHQEGYNDGDYQGDKEYDIHRSSILSDIKYAMIRAIDTPTINKRRRRLVIGFYLLLKGGDELLQKMQQLIFVVIIWEIIPKFSLGARVFLFLV